jgi:hypothetical protein
LTEVPETATQKHPRSIKDPKGGYSVRSRRLRKQTGGGWNPRP